MELEDIRTLIETKNTFAARMGIRIESLSSGAAVAAMELGPAHANLFGTANAGAIFTLAETAFGAAANSHGNQAVAANLSIAYTRPGIAGVLRAEAVEKAAKGPLATYEVTVYDAEGEVVAVCQGTAYRRKNSLDELPRAGFCTTP